MEDKVKQVKERKQKSKDYWAPIYDECAEVQQAINCKTSPIMVKDKDGKEVEDKRRTNVCMPTLSIMVRKNTARLTNRPPEIDFVSRDKEVADKLNIWHHWQYDITNESEVTRKVVFQGESFGIGIAKVYQDEVVINRKMRVKTSQATRSQLLKARGVPESDISAQVGAGSDNLTPEEVVSAVTEFGDELQLQEQVKRYSGPSVKFIFLGDFHLPPGCDSLDTAEWVIEEYVEGIAWLKQMSELTYTDDTGNEVPVMDAKVIAEMIDSDEEIPQPEKESLRDRFRQLVNLNDQHKYDKELRCSKKFKVDECHENRDGKWWIYWVGNEKHHLGEMPYPFDFYGHHAYCDYIPLPSLVSAIGDSTPRLGRYLHRLLNINTGQRQDLITQVLRPLAKVRVGADVPDEAIDRQLYSELQVQRADDVTIERLPEVPMAAWENESAILRAFGMLEPALMSADLAGTNSNPQTGRTATVGVLAQRERDALLQFKIDALNSYFKKVGQRKLWIQQQTMQGQVEIGQKYFGARQEAISSRYGNAAVITLDWPEIQEDIQVEPKAGSTLSVEDEFHAMKAQALFQQALAAPQVFDVPYIAKQYVDTIPGFDSNKAILPPAPPPDPMAQVKMSLNVSMPLDKMPADITNQALEKMGFTPSEDLAHRDTLEGIIKVGEAADAAGKLTEPADGTRPAGEEGIRRTAADRVSNPSAA